MNKLEPIKSDTCSMIVLGAQGALESISPALESLLGISAGDHLGQTHTQIEHTGLKELLGQQGLVILEDSRGKVHQLHHQAILPGDVPGNTLEIHLYQDQTRLRDLQQENERLRIENHELQLTDAITHLMTERAIHLALEPQVSRCRRYDSPLTLVKLVFRLKDAEPDSVETDAQALKISRVLKDQLRWADLIARTGSNEFLIALPETMEQDAVTITRKLKERICLGGDACTVRFGVAGWEKGNNAGDLLYRVDQVLHGDADSQDVA